MNMPDCPVKPDLISYSTLLKGCCHHGDLNMGVRIAEDIKARGLKCDELVYNTLLDGCAKVNDRNLADRLQAEMCQLGIKHSKITKSILRRLYDGSDGTGRARSRRGKRKRDAIENNGRGDYAPSDRKPSRQADASNSR